LEGLEDRNMISKMAVVETKRIGDGVQIGEFCVIRDGVTIGNNVIIHPNVIIESGVTIGNGVEIFPGTYIGKAPKGAGATARPIEFIPQVVIGNNCAIGPNAVIYYDVHIGNDTLIGDGASLREQVRIGNNCLISRYVTINYNTKIGNYTRIMDLTHITGDCVIGDHVFISILVATTNDNVVFNKAYNNEKFLGPQVQDHAIVGSAACLLPGITVREGALVGTNAVVSKDVNEYDVVMGVPARVVRNLKSGSAG
jgi:acetyltransferase-like isoleucine patch superfamily enzyme